MFQKFIDGKKVIVKGNSKNIPSMKLIKNVYSGIPDNKHIPVIFETKSQYLDEYIKNQERKKKTQFTPREVKLYKQKELRSMSGVVSRYTTNHNPFMDRRTVFFTDRKISPTEFRDSAEHEYAHEVWEKNAKVRKDWNSVNRTSSPTLYGRTDKQEDFAESVMLNSKGKLNDPKRKFIIDKDIRSKNKFITPARYEGATFKDMSPRDFLQLAKQTSTDDATLRESTDSYIDKNVLWHRTHPVQRQDNQEDMNKFFESRENSLNDLKDKIQNKEMDTPFIEYNKKTGKPYEHEGRHRAVAAMELGMNKIPIAIFNDPSPNRIQSLFRAGNESPSEALNARGGVFGFTNPDQAAQWGKSKGLSKVYQFQSQDPTFDTKQYASSKVNRGNEYIASNVIAEKDITSDILSKNSVATSVGLPNYPEEVLASDEWKLWGGPKFYTPRTENKSDLRFNVKLASKDNAMGDTMSVNRSVIFRSRSGSGLPEDENSIRKALKKFGNYDPRDDHPEVPDED